MSFFSHDCVLQGHKFEARYDEKPRDGDARGSMSLKDLRELLITRIYIQDICVYCGKTIKRSTP